MFCRFRDSPYLCRKTYLMEDFVHLHVHTYYSILDGQASIEKLVDKAVANGMKGMAVTDHGNMFGIKEFFDVCNKKNSKLKADGKEPFKPIFGCEVYVANSTKESKIRERGDQTRYHLILLAKNKTGYKNLVKIVSRAWVDGYYMRPRTDHADLERFHEGIICCSACLAGELPRKILKGDVDVLKVDDPRRAMQIPPDTQAAGIAPNPR